MTLRRVLLTSAGLIALAAIPSMTQQIYGPNFAWPNYFVYVASSTSHDISGYSIDSTTGKLVPVPGSPFVSGGAGAETNGIAVDPQGNCAVASNENDSSIQAFSIDGLSGILTPSGGLVATGAPGALNGPNPATFHPKGQFVYVPNEAQAQVFGFIENLDCGLTPITGSPFAVPGGPFPDSVVVEPTGRFLYVTINTIPGGVSAFNIDQVTGALTPIAGSPFPAGNSPDSVIVHPSGNWLYVANYDDNTISGYRINPVTGALTAIAGSPFAMGGTGPDAITMHLSGKWLYTANDINVLPGVANTDGFIINQTTGALTRMAGSPFAALAPSNSSSGVAVDPSGVYLYLANENSNNISAFTID
jgi:6-phosphogluconolactonase